MWHHQGDAMEKSCSAESAPTYQMVNLNISNIMVQARKAGSSFLGARLTNITFYVTLLNSSCSTVIGYNWLKQYNLLIDWSSGHITFRSAVHRGPAPTTSYGEATPLPEPITPLNLSLNSKLPKSHSSMLPCICVLVNSPDPSLSK